MAAGGFGGTSVGTGEGVVMVEVSVGAVEVLSIRCDWLTPLLFDLASCIFFLSSVLN